MKTKTELQAEFGRVKQDTKPETALRGADGDCGGAAVFEAREAARKQGSFPLNGMRKVPLQIRVFAYHVCPDA